MPPVLPTAFNTRQDHEEVVISKQIKNVIPLWHMTDAFHRYLNCQVTF